MSLSICSSLLLLCSLGTLSYGQTYPSYGIYSSISNVSSSACPKSGGAHIIVARASLEPPGYGIIGAVKDAVLAQVAGSTAEAVDYPARLTDNYPGSEITGVVAMRELIRNFIAKCAGSPLVVMGYSQGAQVTTDSLVGQNDTGFALNSTIDEPLPASTLSRVAAAVMMGDPSFTLNETFLQGTTTKNGIFPRKNFENFGITGLGSRAKSYCDEGDPYCAFGNNISVHLGYVQEYGPDAVSFVVGQIRSFYANSTGTHGSNGTSTSPTATSSTPAAYTGAASTLRGLSNIGMVPVVCLSGILAFML